VISGVTILYVMGPHSLTWANHEAVKSKFGWVYGTHPVACRNKQIIVGVSWWRRLRGPSLCGVKFDSLTSLIVEVYPTCKAPNVQHYPVFKIIFKVFFSIIPHLFTYVNSQF